MENRLSWIKFCETKVLSNKSHILSIAQCKRFNTLLLSFQSENEASYDARSWAFYNANQIQQGRRSVVFIGQGSPSQRLVFSQWGEAGHLWGTSRSCLVGTFFSRQMFDDKIVKLDCHTRIPQGPGPSLGHYSSGNWSSRQHCEALGHPNWKRAQLHPDQVCS